MRYRTLAELAPQGTFEAEILSEALLDLVRSPEVSAITTRQADNGLWGENFLAFQPTPRDHIDEVGTVAQYRRLVQLGVPTSTRPFRLADRILFRTLSRDDDPELLGEFVDLVGEHEKCAEQARALIREGVCAALAESGHDEDPRLRGAAHRIVSGVSAFLRSPLAEHPLVKRGTSHVLHPDAAPPTWWMLAMMAAMPSLQRERGAFLERLAQYLAAPAPDKSFHAALCGKSLRPTHLVLGDPIELDNKARGMPKDIPLTLHFVELLAAIGPAQLAAAPNASKGFMRLLEDVDADGIWHPKNLRSQPKPTTPITYHCWPLAPDDGELASRQADITFRLACIAKRLGWRLEYS